MKKIFLMAVVFIVAFAISFLETAKAEEIVVSGYQDGDYAVKGAVKERLDGIISQLVGKQVRITVAGSADTTGKSSKNDELAAKRAEHARAYLAGKLPMADVKASWSEGDWANAKQVIITVAEYVQPPVVAPPVPVVAVEKSATKQVPYFLLIIISIGIVMVLLMVPIGERTKRQKAQPPAISSEEEVTISGYIVKIKYIAAENKCYSPFKNTDGSQIYAKTKDGIGGSISRCIKNQKFREQLRKLLENGEIKKA